VDEHIFTCSSDALDEYIVTRTTDAVEVHDARPIAPAVTAAVNP
jgi:hypothetical protein